MKVKTFLAILMLVSVLQPANLPIAIAAPTPAAPNLVVSPTAVSGTLAQGDRWTRIGTVLVANRGLMANRENKSGK
jgi:hypothetical protein